MPRYFTLSIAGYECRVDRTLHGSIFFTEEQVHARVKEAGCELSFVEVSEVVLTPRKYKSVTEWKIV